ncbi:MAG TPA: hypothetical protein VME21_09725 [Steroidobacteraceae bacterium]|nr:hypothetical protein [Steroidobacteraceae bacterium]
MIIRKKLPRARLNGEPLLHPDHPRPVTRRQMLAAGLIGSQAYVMLPSALFGILGKPRDAQAQLASDISSLVSQCGISTTGANKIPFICFDLAGGANLNGSEALIGQSGGQLDFLSTAGYGLLGLPGDMLPNSPNKASPSGNFISTALGLAWHSDGAILRGIQSIASAATQANVNGAAIPAVSSTDTQDNPHNPMYGIWMAGAQGALLNLIGTEATVSGGNSMAPAALINLTEIPSVITQASDCTGLVNTGALGTMFTDPNDAVQVLESTARISGGTNLAALSGKLGNVSVFPGDSATDLSTKAAMQCAYAKTAALVNTFGNPASLNPDLDTNIVGGANSIFTAAQYQNSNIQATAAVMKMVVSGFAAAGTIVLNGYDYHDSTRATGETQNFNAGVCIGAVLEYAKRMGKPVMVYVFSDGSLVSTMMADNSVAGRGKYGWQGDSQVVASTFFLVYNPAGRPTLMQGGSGNQIGYNNSDGSVNTSSSPASNAVNLLVNTVCLNYMALHNQAGNFASVFGTANGLGTTASQLDPLIALNPICNGTIG